MNVILQIAGQDAPPTGASPRGARDRGCPAYRGITDKHRDTCGARCPAYRVGQVREKPSVSPESQSNRDVTGDATPTG